MNENGAMAVDLVENLTSGIPWMDSQLKRILLKIVHLVEGVNHEKGRIEIGTMVKNLEDISISHFQAEESYMLKYGYPNIESHKQHHHNFLKIIETFKNRCFANTLDKEFVDKMHLLMISYWAMHIKNLDKPFGDFVSTIIRAPRK